MFVRTLIIAPIPEEVGDGGSWIGSGTGALNLYLCEWSKGSDLEEKSEKDLRKFEGPGIEVSSLIDKDWNLRITLPSCSSMIWSISLLSICANGWGSWSSISSGRVISSHWEVLE